MDNYKKQATEFLRKHNLVLNIREAMPQKEPLWVKHSDKKGGLYGKNYFCSLTNKDGKHYSFDFWGSIHDLNTGRKPNAYDVLACLDTCSDGESFEDFCNGYGYDTDSKMAEATYNAVMKQIAGLKAIMTPEALSELNEIR